MQLMQYKGKRMLDLTVGSIALIFSLLLFPFIMIGIKLSSRGSVFFKQSRTGQNGVVFTCYKFRTMRQTSAKKRNGLHATAVEGEERTSPGGKRVKLVNVDELAR